MSQRLIVHGRLPRMPNEIEMDGCLGTFFNEMDIHYRDLSYKKREIITQKSV